MVMCEQSQTHDIGLTAGDLHCIKIGNQYLLRVEERQDAEGNIGHLLLPISDISGELIPRLGREMGFISRKDFVTSLRTANTKPIYDVHIRKSNVVEAIRQAVENGNGLALVSGSQILDGNAVSTINGEAVASADCRYLPTRRVSTEPYKLPEEAKSRLYAEAKKLVYSLEAKGSGEDYRLKEADVKMLRKTCGNTALVDDLERTLVADRLILAGIKLLRGVDEGIMVGAGKLEHPITKTAFRLISIAGLIGTNFGQAIFEKKAIHSVSDALRKVLHNIVATHKQEVSAYGLINNSSGDQSLHEKASWIAEKLGRAEQIAPFITEMAPNLLITSGVLGFTGEIIPVLANLGLAAGTYAALRLASVEKTSRIARMLSELLSEAAAGIVADVPAIASSVAPIFSETVEEGSVLVNAVALTGGHASKQIGGIFEMDYGREALKELRNWLQWLDISLVSDEMKKEHCLGILASEDTGPVSDMYVNGKRVRRYSLLDDEEKIHAQAKSEAKKEIYPSLLIKDLTVRMGERVILENTDWHLEWGINVLYTPPNSGKTEILKSLADKLAHPTGTLLLRQADTDVNVHGESEKELVRYIDCSGKEETGLPNFIGTGYPDDIKDYQSSWEKSNHQLKQELDQILQAKYIDNPGEACAAADFLYQCGMFTDEEIIEYFSDNDLSPSVRSRLWLAFAGWITAPVVLLDNLYATRELDGIDERFITFHSLIEHFFTLEEDEDFDKGKLADEFAILCQRLGMGEPSKYSAAKAIIRDNYDKIRSTAAKNNFIRSGLYRYSRPDNNRPIILLSSSEDVGNSPYHKLDNFKNEENVITVHDHKFMKTGSSSS